LKAQIGAVITVLAILVLAFASVAFTILNQAHTSTISTTRTVTILSARSPVVTEEVIIQPQEINDICIIQLTNSTSTSYLAPVNSTVNIIGSQTARTTTEILRAITTATIYDNVTEISSGVTCTFINPHYNVTQSLACPPCA
jgi:hypothetical protein